MLIFLLIYLLIGALVVLVMEDIINQSKDGFSKVVVFIGVVAIVLSWPYLVSMVFYQTCKG